MLIPSTISCGFCSYCRFGYTAQCDVANPNGPSAGTAARVDASIGFRFANPVLPRQDDLRPKDLVKYAAELGLDADQFHEDLIGHVHGARIARGPATG